VKTADEVLSLYLQRREFYQPLQAAQASIAAIYDGEALVQLPDMGRDEPSSVPNLLAQGIDQMAGRISSVIPQVTFTSENPGQRMADRRAVTAGQTVTGWWERDRLPQKMKMRARHLIAYGLAPVMMRWNDKMKQPTWEVRKATEALPNLDRIPGSSMPVDVIFTYQRTASWLAANGYGPQMLSVMGGRERPRTDAAFILLEHVDSDGVTLVLAGQTDPRAYMYSWGLANQMIPLHGWKAEVLESYETFGVMTGSVPTRLTLNRPGGQFDSMTGMFYAQSKLMALEVLAVEKGIFPDTYLIGRPGETPRFIDGPYDGRTGQINVVAGGDIKDMATQPGYMTPQTIDRLERSQRVTAGIPAEFGGESGSNIRTGRRGDAVLSAVIDFPVAESQEVLGYGLVDENKAAIALAKHFDGSATRTIYVGTGNSRKPVTYVADTVFPHDDHTVNYPVVGTDMNSLMIGLGQRVGMGIMSKQSAAEIDPFIVDPEVEHDRIISEGLEQSLVAGIQQQAASGQIPPMVLAKVMTLVKNDKMELAEAMTKVVEDAAKQQQPQQSPSADQMAAPGAAALTGSPIPGPTQGQQDLGNLLSRLRQPVMAVADRSGTVSANGRQAV